MRYYKKEIHYNDFLAFGEDQFIRCKNILTELNNMSSGNLSTHAYEGYKMIMQAQLDKSRREENEAKFKTSIQDWEKMEPMALKLKCHEAAEAMRSEAQGLLRAMEDKNPHQQFKRRQKVMTETRRQNKEDQEGITMLNPSEVIPKYLENEEVRNLEKNLIECAEKKRIPTDDEFKKYTNLLLVRLNIKNGKRQEIFIKCTRGEFIEAKLSGVKVLLTIIITNLPMTHY